MLLGGGGYTVPRLPGLEILSAMHATSQAHETGFPFAAHIERKRILRWKLGVVQFSSAEY